MDQHLREEADHYIASARDVILPKIQEKIARLENEIIELSVQYSFEAKRLSRWVAVVKEYDNVEAASPIIDVDASSAYLDAKEAK